MRISSTEISRSSPDSCASVQRRDAMVLSKDFAFSQNCCCFTCAYLYVIPLKPVLWSTNGAMCSWVLEVPWGSARAGGLISVPAAQRARLPPRRLLKLKMSDPLREMSILARFALPLAAPGCASPSRVTKRFDAAMDSAESGSAAESMSVTTRTSRSLLHRV